MKNLESLTVPNGAKRIQLMIFLSQNYLKTIPNFKKKSKHMPFFFHMPKILKERQPLFN